MAVTRIDILARHPYGEEGSPIEPGEFERIEGRAWFEVDPRHPANRTIIDLEHAVNTGHGTVTFSTDFSLVTPADPSRRGSKLLVDVPNRGNRLASATLHKVPAINPEDRLKAGDAFLCRRNVSFISIGWQWDAEGDVALRLHPPVAMPDGQPARGPVMMKLQPSEQRESLPLVQLGQTSPPYPVLDPDSADRALYVREHENAERRALPIDQWGFGRIREGERTPSNRHIWLEGGFEAGLIFELVYITEGAPVVGAGLLAVRDLASCLKYNETASVFQRPFEHVMAFGVSQTGRFLRDMLYQGQNADEYERRVFDGMWLHIAGAQRGDFNFRFAQPTVATIPSLGQRYPFAAAETRDLFSDRSESLLDNLAPEHRPKLIISNTSFEYWRGDASLAHIQGDADIAEAPGTRHYMIAGTHHIGGLLIGGKQITEVAATGLKVAMPLNVINYAPVSRAMFSLLDEWVTDGREPPPSVHPRLSDGTASTRADILSRFRAAGGFELLHEDKLNHIRYQQPQPENGSGIVSPPITEGDPYPAWVSAVDADLNETAGIKLPDITVPLGTHTGWNPRGKGTGAEDQPAIFAGFSRFFSPDEVRSRYPTESDYLAQVETAIDALVTQRYVLEEDRDWMLANARDRYHAALAGN